MLAYQPSLALVTGSAELLLAYWAFTSPGRRSLLQVVGVLLVLLAGYQFAEIFVCSRPSDPFFARLAFADIVWLPPVGVLLISRLAGGRGAVVRWGLQALFASAAGLTLWVMLDPSFVTRSVCSVVIARYVHGTPFYAVYGGFYQLGLLIMLVGAALGLAGSDEELQRRHLADVQLGTLGFVLASLLTQVLVPELIGTMPSVMCHYAAVLALFLARVVARERRTALVGAATPAGDCNQRLA